MQLLAVELADFRNAPTALVTPHPRFNVIAGDNGQGKTNFLEAIYLVGTLRSFRATRLDELVRFGCTSTRASARVDRRGIDRRYDVEITVDPAVASRAARKSARVDGKTVRAAADYFGGFNIVLFSPDDLRLPRGSPSARRRFVDRAVWNVEPGFLKHAQTYEKVLRSRNALLRDGAPGGARLETLLDVYDEQLASAGALVVERRHRYIEALGPRVAAAYQRITRSGLAVRSRYAACLDATGTDLAPAMLEALRAARRRDQQTGHTTFGPHGDDLELDLDGRPARLYASQGQLRALVLALKVAEIQHLATVLDDAPVLLLDDVSSELDPARNAFLFEFLAEASGQVFITTTDAAHVRLSSDRADFRVTAGAIERF